MQFPWSFHKILDNQDTIPRYWQFVWLSRWTHSQRRWNVQFIFQLRYDQVNARSCGNQFALSCSQLIIIFFLTSIYKSITTIAVCHKRPQYSLHIPAAFSSLSQHCSLPLDEEPTSSIFVCTIEGPILPHLSLCSIFGLLTHMPRFITQKDGAWSNQAY